MDSDLTLRAGIKDTIPTMFGYMGVGMAFGVVANTSHLPLLAILLMSLLIYAGSVEFVVTAMLVAGDPISAIILSAFLINSRIILMSISISQYFKRDSMRQNFFIGSLLTDETFALAMTKINQTEGRLTLAWFNTANILAYLSWILATAAGALLGSLINDAKQFGLDFALVVMFIGLLYLQIINDHSKSIQLQLTVVFAVAVMMYFFMRWLPGELALLLASILGCFLGMGLSRSHAD
ncbi:AzlC family ABC transporter permease [Oenococcus sicerae]|uniref:AzlC family ABC transporter permease n=1 Tax=Oenococcus sicerae TaxID=2203724 RepID=A0ABX5QL24_9LACO|nr:AzlC family ABC transporter permease [Oenococcus sicerae]QAS69457.1 AzlC family ABC transporter permease [Oenococcus sicerae]